MIDAELAQLESELGSAIRSAYPILDVPARPRLARSPGWRRSRLGVAIVAVAILAATATSAWMLSRPTTASGEQVQQRALAAVSGQAQPTEGDIVHSRDRVEVLAANKTLTRESWGKVHLRPDGGGEPAAGRIEVRDEKGSLVHGAVKAEDGAFYMYLPEQGWQPAPQEQGQPKAPGELPSPEEATAFTLLQASQRPELRSSTTFNGHDAYALEVTLVRIAGSVGYRQLVYVDRQTFAVLGSERQEFQPSGDWLVRERVTVEVSETIAPGALDKGFFANPTQQQ